MTPSVLDIERVAYATWSADETTTIGGWTVRSNGGFTRRVNSATTESTAQTSPAVRDAIAAWLEERGVPLTVRITPLVEDDTRVAVERSWDLEEHGDTVVLGREVDPEVRPDPSVRLVRPRHEEFSRDLVALNDRDDSAVGAWRGILERIGGRGAGVWIPGRAAGFVAAADGIAMVYSVAVDPRQRRRGNGARIMQGAMSWARDAGARWMVLQVLGTNDEALGLYDALRYRELYRYHYLQAVPGSARPPGSLV